MYDLDSLFNIIGNLKVAVIGDVMLDTYWWGGVDRISPEAPVPVVNLKAKDYRIGGAGNVALNTTALGAATTLFSVVGSDIEGEQLVQLIKGRNINTEYLLKSDQRITTNKTRIMSRNQQMMRLDNEVTNDLTALEESSLLQNFMTYVEEAKPSVVILEDYNKGILTEKVITEVIAICNKNNIITTVDPKRKNFFAYKFATIFKPNLKEIRDAFNMVSVDTSEQGLQQVHRNLQEVLHHKISFITLAEKGVFYHDESRFRSTPSHIRNIADVSGAGDTVIAVASLVYAGSGDINLASSIANIAGGLVCEEVGTVCINKEDLMMECRALLH